MISEVRIEKIGGQGQGVGSDAAGNIYFVPGTLPGDIALVESETEQKRYRDACLVEVKVRSPLRQTPVCPYFGECGGCDWLNFEYAAQLRAKESMLKHILGRAGLSAEEFFPAKAAERIYGYRNRIQLRREGAKLGFYKRRSHEIVDIERCAVADPRLNEVIVKLREEKVGEGRTKIELAVDTSGEVVRWENKPHASAGFVQINPEQNQFLRNYVASEVKRLAGEKVLELFCGNGNLTFAYAPFVKTALAVEASERAIASAVEQRQKAGVGHVEFLRAMIGPGLARRYPQISGSSFDLLLLDPPRAGAGLSMKEISRNTKNVLYVSCAPLSFAQDVRPLVNEGFVLKRVQPIDMFPHTRHIEMVATLSRE